MREVKEVFKRLAKVERTNLSKIGSLGDRTNLTAINDADSLYDQIVKGTQRQAAVLAKVESELKSLESKAKELQAMETKIESMAKELGIDLDTNYAAKQWVSDLSKYASQVGNIAAVL